MLCIPGQVKELIDPQNLWSWFGVGRIVPNNDASELIPLSRCNTCHSWSPSRVVKVSVLSNLPKWSGESPNY